MLDYKRLSCVRVCYMKMEESIMNHDAATALGKKDVVCHERKESVKSCGFQIASKIHPEFQALNR